MFRHIFSFEFRLWARRVSTVLFFLLFFVIGYMAVVRGRGPLKLMGGLSSGITDTSAPYVLHFLINIMGYAGTLIACAVFGQAGLRDFRDRTHGLIFSYPIRKTEYLAGRFAAAFAATAAIFAGTGLGAWLGGAAPLFETASSGPARPAAYFLPYLAGVLPTLLVAGALFFALALLTRKMLPVYAGGIAIMVLHLMGGALAVRTGTRLAGALIDPFGEFAARSIYGMWSLAERGERLVPLAGPYLLNRLIWLAAAVLILVVLWRRFQFREVEESREAHEKRSLDLAGDEVVQDEIGPVVRRFDLMTRIRQTLSAAAFEFGGIVRSTAFLVILLLVSILQFVVSFRNIGLVRETTAYPLTSQVLDAGLTLLHPALLLVILFCSGELVRRDRARKVNALLDAAPVPEGVFFLGKAAALIAVTGVVIAIAMANGLAVQAIQGWTRFQPGLYLTELFGVRFVYFALIAIFALFAQVLAGNRVLGYLIVLLFTDDLPAMLGLEHRLWTFGQTPPYIYSDMSGYGPFARAILSYNLYWLFAAVLVVVATLLLYVRGEDSGLKSRLRDIRLRWTPQKWSAIGIGVLGCVVFGGWIVYNTTVLNRFEPAAWEERRSADYEKTFKAYEIRPQPRATDLSWTVDLYPEERRIVSRGVMTFANKTEGPIEEIFVQTPRNARVKRLDPGLSAVVGAQSPAQGVRILKLAEPIRPGESIRIAFDLEVEEKGFKDHGVNTGLVRNGTSLDYRHLLPSLGYNRFEELESASARKRQGLAPRRRLPAADEPGARMSTIIGPDSDWIRFEAVLGTSKDQIALTAGELVETWEKDGRRYFRYEARGRILKYLPFLSASYKLQKDRWGDVAIEVYYHPGHDFNVGRMISAAKTSLRLFSEKFGPYPYGAVRIVEFPRYELSGEAFPEVVPLSEGYGFIARHKGAGVEELVRVIAHEVSHQWWGMQTIGAGVEGEFFICESLAQHSALMVLRGEYSEATLADYMKTRIDRYLRGRARESSAEKPLARTDFETSYVHYDKGMVVMNALRKIMGEGTLDAAVRSFFEKGALRTVPFPIAEEFIEELLKEAPDGARETVREMVEDIVLYDNRALGAEAEEFDGGKYKVDLRVEAVKNRCDESGKEMAAPFRNELEFGVFGERGEILYRGWRPVEAGPQVLEFIVDRPPAQAGIDPFHLLIDRNPNDNLVAVNKRSEIK